MDIEAWQKGSFHNKITNIELGTGRWGGDHKHLSIWCYMDWFLPKKKSNSSYGRLATMSSTEMIKCRGTFHSKLFLPNVAIFAMLIMRNLVTYSPSAILQSFFGMKSSTPLAGLPHNIMILWPIFRTDSKETLSAHTRRLCGHTWFVRSYGHNGRRGTPTSSIKKGS